MVRKSKPAVAFEVVAVAASAGGLNALSRVLGDLPEEFSAPLLVVQHLDPRHKSLMAQILARRTALSVEEARDGEEIQEGHIYVAPSNKHLLVAAGGILSLTQSELVNFVRPSADLMFESIAACFGDKVIAVILSGSGSDGTNGLKAVKEMGGTTIAQDEKTSEHFGMPGSAIKTGCVDFVLSLEEIAPALVMLVEKESKP